MSKMPLIFLRTLERYPLFLRSGSRVIGNLIIKVIRLNVNLLRTFRLQALIPGKKYTFFIQTNLC